MSTVTIGITSREQASLRVIEAFKGNNMGNRISFESYESLFKTLTLKRWDILKALTGSDPLSIREAARLVGRDVKAVHGDITALLNAGIVDKTENNKITFPYEKVHVDFELSSVG